MTRVNPEVLRWARETAGLSIADACKKINIRETKEAPASQTLMDYEAGEKEPSRTTLQKMEKLYHRPMIAFFMDYVPQKASRGQDFRTLSGDYSEKDAALVDALIRDIESRQRIIKASLEEDEEGVKILSFVHSIKKTESIENVVRIILEEFDIKIEQFYSESSQENAFAYLRERIESKGIFVLLLSNLGSHHTKIELSGFRGFSLADEIAPFIVINEQDAKGALSFTLIHELTHICLGQTGISNDNSGKDIERFCDAVASKCLLPDSELSKLKNLTGHQFEDWQNAIDRFARQHNISHSMIVFRLHEFGKIDQSLVNSLLNYYKEKWLESQKILKEKMKQKKGGPNYYVTQQYKIGKSLLNTVNRLVTIGALSTSKASMVLGMKYESANHLLSQR